jgi:hypothetical protein
MVVIFMVNYSFSGDKISVNNEVILLTDFVNLKIKPAQSFEYTHRDMMHVCVLIWVSDRTCINMYVYTMFFKKELCRWHWRRSD